MDMLMMLDVHDVGVRDKNSSSNIKEAVDLLSIKSKADQISIK